MSNEFRGQVERSAITSTPGKFQRRPIGSATKSKGQPAEVKSLTGDSVMRSGMKGMNTSTIKGQPSSVK